MLVRIEEADIIKSLIEDILLHAYQFSEIAYARFLIKLEITRENEYY